MVEESKQPDIQVDHESVHEDTLMKACSDSESDEWMESKIAKKQTPQKSSKENFNLNTLAPSSLKTPIKPSEDKSPLKPSPVPSGSKSHISNKSISPNPKKSRVETRSSDHKRRNKYKGKKYVKSREITGRPHEYDE